VNAPTSARSGPRGAKRSQLSDDVARHLRDAILTGELKAGTFIRLDDTAAHLDVSITPVREALLTLRGEGLVQLEPRRGYVVLPLSRQDLADIFWLQATIAKELAITASQQFTDDQIEDLEEANEIFADAIVRGDWATLDAAEFALHRLFNRTTGRVKLAWFLVHLARYLRPLIDLSDQSWREAAVESHRRFIDALRRRDTAALTQLVDAEFTGGAQRLTELLERRGMWS